MPGYKKPISAFSKKMISRRSVLAGAAAGASVLAMPAIVRAQQGGRVLVRTSGGSYQEALEQGTWSKFTEMTGIEVVPVPANTARLLAMAEAGDGQIDLVEANATAILTLHQRDALEPIDLGALEYTNPDDLSVVDDYFIGYAIFSEAMCYNTEHFADGHPASWAEFWDVSAFPGSRMMQDASAIAPNLEFALLADGVAPEDLYPLDVDRAFAKMEEIKPHVVNFFDSGALGASLLAEGTAVVGPLWTNRVQVLKEGGAPLEVEWNENMRLFEYSAILKNAPNRDNAMRLLDYSSSPEAQAATLPQIGLSPDNSAAFEFISEDVAANLPGSAQNMAKGFSNDAAWWLEHRAEVATRWQEFMLL